MLHGKHNISNGAMNYTYLKCIDKFSKLRCIIFRKMIVRCGMWNINGVTTKLGSSSNSKLEFDDVKEMLCKYHIFGLVETHTAHNSNHDIKGYRTYKQDRMRGKRAKKFSGGIAVYVCEKLQHGITCVKQSPEIIWLRLKKEIFVLDEDIYLAFTYANPENSSYQPQENHLEMMLNDLSNFNKLGRCIVMGDLNGRVGDLPDYPEFDGQAENFETVPLPYDYEYEEEYPLNRYNKDKHRVDPRGSEILELCIASGMRILNGRTFGDLRGTFTCYSHRAMEPSVIDYGIAHYSLMSKIRYFKVEDFTTYSDHCMIGLGIAVGAVAQNNKPKQLGTTKLKRLPDSWIWARSCIPGYQETLMSEECSERIGSFMQSNFSKESACINKATECFQKLVEYAAQKALVPLQRKRMKKKRKKYPKYIDINCQVDMKWVKRLCHRVSRDPFNRSLRQQYYTAKKAVKKSISRNEKKLRNSLTQKLETLQDKDPQTYWKILNELANINLEREKSEQSSNIDPEQWLSHFKELYSQQLSGNRQSGNDQYILDKLNELKSMPYFSSLDFRITREEILTAVGKLKIGKAAGLDRIPNELLKYGMPHLVEPMHKLFNLVFSSSIFPDNWSISMIKPLHKGGSFFETKNYRGVSIMSCVGKVFCSVLNSRVVEYLEGQGVPGYHQIAFRRRYRTSDHVMVIQTLINKYIKKLQYTARAEGKALFAAFVDLEKAYDTVWRGALFYKMLNNGIGGTMFKIIENMYSKYIAAIKLENGYTAPFATERGVKQGCVLSPILFNLYINDLPDIFNENCDPVKIGDKTVNCLMFADDLVLISLTSAGLQACLEKVQNYCATWRLKVNVTKTKVMIFNKSGHMKKKYVFKIDGIQLDIVKEYKYLGVTLNISDSAKQTAKIMKDKALKAIFKILKSFNGRPSSIKVGIKLFETLVKPIMLYGSESWGAGLYKFEQLLKIEKGKTKLYFDNPLEKLQIKWYKGLLGVNRKATNIAVLAELGKYPVAIDIATNLIKYWLRIVNFDSSALIYECYTDNVLLLQGQNKCWLKAVREILYATGFHQVWLDQNTQDKTHLASDVREKLEEIYQEQWKLDLWDDPRADNSQGNKLRTYRRFKEEHKMELYLTKVKDTKTRKDITRLRISAHSLEIEKGRYLMKPIEERKCNNCSVIEDEFHVLMKCPSYEEARNGVFMELTNARPPFGGLSDQEKFVELMTMNDELFIYAVSKLIKNISQVRGCL